jgi:hypothetical protein
MWALAVDISSPKESHFKFQMEIGEPVAIVPAFETLIQRTLGLTVIAHAPKWYLSFAVAQIG